MAGITSMLADSHEQRSLLSCFPSSNLTQLHLRSFSVTLSAISQGFSKL
jgi:hypothetical protein